HERLDEQTKRVRFGHLELFQQCAQRLGFAAAFHQILQTITDLVVQEFLHLREVDEVTDRMDAPIRLEQVPNGSAVRVAARQWCEILEAQVTTRLFHRSEDDVGCVQARGTGRGPRVSRY